MIHKEPLASYLKRRVFLGALGLSEGEPVVFSPLGQGEYNVNYSFIHPRTGKKLVLRINTAARCTWRTRSAMSLRPSSTWSPAADAKAPVL